jgi:hypothetical protein
MVDLMIYLATTILICYLINTSFMYFRPGKGRDKNCVVKCNIILRRRVEHERGIYTNGDSFKGVSSLILS